MRLMHRIRKYSRTVTQPLADACYACLYGTNTGRGIADSGAPFLGRNQAGVS
jgi:hypothetical protein